MAPKGSVMEKFERSFRVVAIFGVCAWVAALAIAFILIEG